MPKKYEVVITPQAEKYLLEIRDYISNELGSPTAAVNTLTLLGNATESLEQLPNRIPLAREEKWRDSGIHKMTVKNFLIYFTVDEEDSTVYILAFVYARRDQKKILDNIL